MGETSSQKTGKRHERLFLLCAVLAAALCPFRRVEDAAAVPGLTEDIVASWAELAYVS